MGDCGMKLAPFKGAEITATQALESIGGWHDWSGGRRGSRSRCGFRATGGIRLVFNAAPNLLKILAKALGRGARRGKQGGEGGQKQNRDPEIFHGAESVDPNQKSCNGKCGTPPIYRGRVIFSGVSRSSNWLFSSQPFSRTRL